VRTRTSSIVSFAHGNRPADPMLRSNQSWSDGAERSKRAPFRLLPTVVRVSVGATVSFRLGPFARASLAARPTFHDRDAYDRFLPPKLLNTCTRVSWVPGRLCVDRGIVRFTTPLRFGGSHADDGGRFLPAPSGAIEPLASLSPPPSSRGASPVVRSWFSRERKPPRSRAPPTFREEAGVHRPEMPSFGKGPPSVAAPILSLSRLDEAMTRAFVDLVAIRVSPRSDSRCLDPTRVHDVFRRRLRAWARTPGHSNGLPGLVVVRLRFAGSTPPADLCNTTRHVGTSSSRSILVRLFRPLAS
jgi:hypothetical protein